MGDSRRGTLPRAEIVALSDAVRSLLADEHAALSPARRSHLEGALAALEAVLGQPSSLLDPERADEIRSLL